MRLLSYATKRLLLIPISMFVVISLSFKLTSLIPGDPTVLILNDFTTPEQVTKINTQLETDQPFLVHYWHYVKRLAHKNLGTSYFTGQPIGHNIAQLLPNTLQLAIFSAVVTIVLGFVLNNVSAYFHLQKPDRSTSVAITVLQTIPNFVLALVLIYIIFFLLD